MPIFKLNEYLKLNQYLINKTLKDVLKRYSYPGGLADAMGYSLLAGGKRIRPILCIAAAEAVGGSGDHVIRPACALEIIHTYSLIHDDLPAMDDDDLRRGKPTSHIAFDEATAILAGDALLTLAFQVIAENPDGQGPAHDKQVEIIAIIARAAGCTGMVGGQMKDMASEGKKLTLNELKEMYAQKTGALIEAAVRTGLILGNATCEQIDRLEVYAKNIGLAFQISDDLLDIEGDPSIMGKSAGMDEFRSKNTYPSILGIDESKGLASGLVNKALKALESFDSRSEPLRSIAAYIIERNR